MGMIVLKGQCRVLARTLRMRTHPDPRDQGHEDMQSASVAIKTPLLYPRIVAEGTHCFECENGSFVRISAFFLRPL